MNDRRSLTETRTRTTAESPFGNRVPVLTSAAQLSAAFDPDGIEVWCDFAEDFAFTNDGHCQYCGRKDHKRASGED